MKEDSPFVKAAAERMRVRAEELFALPWEEMPEGITQFCGEPDMGAARRAAQRIKDAKREAAKKAHEGMRITPQEK